MLCYEDVWPVEVGWKGSARVAPYKDKLEWGVSSGGGRSNESSACGRSNGARWEQEAHRAAKSDAKTWDKEKGERRRGTACQNRRIDCEHIGVTI